jgi:hypothetical protein
MYARKVSLCLKSESVSLFLQTVELEVIPLFRKQKGFLDQLVLLTDNGEMSYVYTFWESGEDVEKCDRTTLPALNQLLTAVADGAVRIHAFGGWRGRLSGGLPQHQS